MDAAEAKRLVHLLARIGGDLNQSVAFVRDNDDEAHFLKYREAVGNLMGDLFDHGMIPLYKRFPELKPDYLDGPYTIPPEVYQPPFYEFDKPTE